MQAVEGSAVRGVHAARAPEPPSGRPALGTIERNYQVAEEASRNWSPMYVGTLGGTQKLTLTEAKLLDQLTLDRGLLGLKKCDDVRHEAFDTADRRSPPSRDVPAAVERRIEAMPVTQREQQRLRDAWPKNDGHNDAFRHAFWNARMTSEFGVTWTKAFATAHEGNNPGSSTREAMDLYNNEIGRKVALDHPGASAAELADHVKRALDEGKLVVIDKSGHLAWSNTVAIGDHGITVDLGTPAKINTPGVVRSAS